MTGSAPGDSVTGRATLSWPMSCARHRSASVWGLCRHLERLERDFEPGAVRQLKARSERDLTVGGPDLAAQAIKSGLVDEFHLFLSPIVVGGGKKSLPDKVRLQLDLLDERRFGNGVVYLRYRTHDVMRHDGVRAS